jgi:hypothetical protein
MEGFNLIKSNEVEGKEKYRVDVSNRFLPSENLEAEVEINSAWEMITENITISANDSLGDFYLRKNKPLFGEGDQNY